MLKIRLQRTGRTNDPSFRVIVVEHTESAKTGSFVEQVGTYNPKTKAKNLIGDRIKYWLSVGAKASGTVHNMLVSAGIVSGNKVNVLPKKNVARKDAQLPPTPSAGDGATGQAQNNADAALAGDEELKGAVSEEKKEEVAAEVPVETAAKQA